MTDTFTASNGMTVERDHNGDVLLDRATTPSLYMKDGTALALREFFMHEQGIWIDGESGALALLNHVPIDRRYLSIFMNGTMYGVHESQPGEGYESTPQDQVARRFFKAHPERKPWEDATYKDVWVWTTADGTQEALGWVAGDGTWDIITPKGDGIKAAENPMTALVDAGFEKFSGTVTGVRRTPEDAS